VPQAHDEAMWCLARANEPPCVLSTRELLIVAQLGYLRADDRLWRPGSTAARSIRSMLDRPPSSPALAPSAGMEQPAGGSGRPSASDDLCSDASATASALGADERRELRSRASVRTLAGVAIGAVLLAAIAVAAFLQSGAAVTGTAGATQVDADSADPVAAAGQTPASLVTTDEVAVRKVKVLTIAAPPPPGH
jgi:hypothetical protein